MEAKEKAIREAYGEHWEKVKDTVSLENGWCVMYNSNNEKVSPNFIELGMDHDYVENNINSGYDHETNIHEWRPKSLAGIENNNGWIKIESAADLPKETIACWFYDEIEDSIVCGNYNADFKKFNWSGFIVEWGEQITHYQPIIKPNLPIY